MVPDVPGFPPIALASPQLLNLSSAHVKQAPLRKHIPMGPPTMTIGNLMALNTVVFYPRVRTIYTTAYQVSVWMLQLV